MTGPVRRKIRLGELLVQNQVITAEQLTKALAEQKRTGRKLGRVLADLGMVAESALHDFLSKHLQVPFVDLKQLRIDGEAVRLLPEPLARRHRALVLQQDARGLLVGMADPTDLHAFDELQARLKLPIRLALIGESDFLRTVDSVYRRTDEIASLAEAVRDELSEGDVDLEALQADEGSPDAPVLRLLQSMFHDAAQVRASDIHIEPGENNLRIRMRVDGTLQEQVLDGRRVASALVTRLKLMCGLDIAEKRLPQDGRFSLRIRDAGYDVRLATMPTTWGESVVMRLLDQSTALLTLDRLGMPADTEARFRRLVERTAGMVLVTGPTGSGKTTTLYAALSHLNRPGVKVLTVEDPVEYRLDRITQVQVNGKIGLDFARVLRTALRQDPDILLVGEMRDRETVEIGLRGAMTGHLVFSTLHTNDAPSAITRLVDMGVKPFLVASSIQAVLAQRLIRVLCKQCKGPLDESPDPKYMRLCGITPEEGAGKVLKPVGCPNCNSTGYRGRQAIFEMMTMSSEIRDLAFKLAPISDLRRAARAHGMKPLVDDGKVKILKGMTTPEEVARNTQVDLDNEAVSV